MSEKKSLQQHINEFQNKVRAQESKIANRINDLKVQASKLRTTIKDQSSKIVELEMFEDSTGISELQKNNREMRLQLEEIQDSIQSYEEQHSNQKKLYAKDLEKLRTVANKAAEERIKEIDGLGLEAIEIESQIEALNHKLKQVRHEGYVLEMRTEVNDLKQIISYIDPRANELDFFKKEQLIKNWLGNYPTESLFEEPKPYNGITVSSNNADWNEMQAMQNDPLPTPKSKVTKI